jgi:hypothetical protein
MDFVVEFNSEVSWPAVVLVAPAGSERTTRPAAPRSELRTKDFILNLTGLAISKVLRHNQNVLL